MYRGMFVGLLVPTLLQHWGGGGGGGEWGVRLTPAGRATPMAGWPPWSKRLPRGMSTADVDRGGLAIIGLPIIPGYSIARLIALM